ncbi:WD40 repeat domain-containing protein [Pontibacter sp. BAB1700]|uniref:WD40 repeat domain-containing protein n=1 Tax=Pontibacter sp. BAB1700 TaxID=1144253 RepID=UPI00026BDE0D|nr:serine/threonine protein kinase [Pontibacter sp. BAB1700]EJF08397.1 serine/threonine protein kinase with WD40 repeats [Pontibacter sp. BAB1700]
MKKIFLAAAFLPALATNAQNQTLKPFDLQGKVVHSIDYSPDGLLLAGAYDNNIQLWQLGKDSSSFKLSDTVGPVTDLDFSNDSRHLLAAHGNSAKIWDVEKREVIRTFEQKGALLAVAYSLIADMWLWEEETEKCRYGKLIQVNYSILSKYMVKK